jgi:hypothetical protein
MSLTISEDNPFQVLIAESNDDPVSELISGVGKGISVQHDKI